MFYCHEDNDVGDDNGKGLLEDYGAVDLISIGPSFGFVSFALLMCEISSTLFP